MSKRPAQPEHPAGLLDSLQSEVAGEASPLLEFLLHHAGLIIAGVVLFIIVIAGFGAYNHFSGKAEKEAQNELGSIVVIPDHQKRLVALEAYMPKATAGTRATALFTLAETALAVENYDKAVEAWTAVAKLDKALRIPAGYGLARALTAQGKNKEAMAVYEDLLNGITKHDILPVNTEIAWLAESTGDYKRALAAVESILSSPVVSAQDLKIWTIKAAELRTQINKAS